MARKVCIELPGTGIVIRAVIAVQEIGRPLLYHPSIMSLDKFVVIIIPIPAGNHDR